MDATQSTSGVRKPDPLVGQVLDGRYLVQRLVARGGMGKIYQATQVQLGRTVALKVMDLGYSEDLDPGFKRRFYLEAATCAGLSHPNTIRVFDYGNAGDVYYIAMEFIDGRTLLQLVEDEAPIEPLRAVHITRQVAGALAEAHGKGLIHRDLKPSNVLLTRHADQEDFVKVLDFGLVKLMREDAEEMTKAGLFLGSPNYMSPEQIRSSKLDQRSDLYSLGVILYMAVTGHSPFKRDSSVHALLAQLEEPPPPIQVARPGLVLPRALEWTIFTLLEKDPDRRFARVEELMKALRVVEAECRGELPSLDGLTLENGRVVGPAGFADPGSVRMRAPSASPGEHSLSRPLPSPTPPPKPAMPPEAPRETPSPPPAAPPSPPSPPARDGAIRRRPARGPGAVRRDSEPSRLVLASLAFLALLLMSALVWLVSRPLEPAPEVVAPQVAGVPPALVPLLVRTEPAGADVVRQGEVLGRTPLEISLPRGESWRLELRQSGYVNRLIDVRGGEELPPLALTPVPRGDSRAPGATPSAPIAAPPPAEATPKRDPSPAPGSDLRDPWAG